MEETKKLKKSVRIRLQKEAEQARKDEMAGKLGAARASLANVPTSPRKMRLVADLIRGKGVFDALNILKYEPKVGASYLEKVLETAIANWTLQNEELGGPEANDLFIKEIFINCGPMLKRLRPAPQGRGYRIRKRSNHITMVVDSANNMEEAQVQEAVVLEEEKPELKQTGKSKNKSKK